MQVYLDKDGYVISYAIIGTLVDGIEVEELKDLRHFQENYQAYKVVDNQLVFDSAYAAIRKISEKQQELRERRETECFSIINRGQLWYDSLTPQQRTELRDWYNAWLNVTETLVVPEKPAWL